MGRCNLGLKAAAQLLINTGSPTAFSYIELGSGTTAFAATQTTLVTAITDSGLARALATLSTVTTTVADDTSNLTYTWTASGSKTIAESGVFNAATAGVMFCRQVLGTARSVGTGDTFVGTWKITHT